VRAGELGRELFFIRRGEARAYLGPNCPVWGVSTEVAIIKAGSYFGELAMLTGLPRGSYVMATSYCICSILPYSAVESLVEMHPEAFTTLVQTMVRMYGLKPETNWKILATKMTKRFAILNEQDAFLWLRSFSETHDDDLCAKSFDLALQKLNVCHLDRRIFWAELDKDADGGISFDEFRGKLCFDAEDDTPTILDSQTKPSCLTKMGGQIVVHPEPAVVKPFASEASSMPPAGQHFKRPSTKSEVSYHSESSPCCKGTRPNNTSQPSFDGLMAVERQVTGASIESQTSGENIIGTAANEDKVIELLVQQNRRLLQALQACTQAGRSGTDPGHTA